MQQSAVHWWRKLGYPAFEPGEQGFPRPGQVLKHYRLLKRKANGKPWAQADLARVLGVNVLAVSEMENKDVGLKDIHRLRQIAALFAIPPLLLGIVSLEEIQFLSGQDTSLDVDGQEKPGEDASVRPVEKQKCLNTHACQQALQGFWGLNHQSTVYRAISQILKHSQVSIVRITTVYKQLCFSPYGANPRAAKPGLHLKNFWNTDICEG